MKIELFINNNKVIVSHVAFIKLVKLGCWFDRDTLTWNTMDGNNMAVWNSEWYRRQWAAHGN